jgi:hypothetical protein
MGIHGVLPLGNSYYNMKWILIRPNEIKELIHGVQQNYAKLIINVCK